MCRATIAAATEGVDWPAHWAASPEAAAAMADVEHLIEEGRKECQPLVMASTYAQSFGVQVGGFATLTIDG